MSKAPIPVGEAIYTTAENSLLKGIVHAPTMEKPSQSTTVEKIRKATLRPCCVPTVMG